MLDRLQGVVTGCKIGSQLFTAAGPTAIELAHRRGFRVFLDLKFHDIPNTVAGAVREATRSGVFMLNVHASGGLAMMRAAAESATKAAAEFKIVRPVCIGVTVLTSLDRRALDHEVGVARSVEAHVLHLADRAREAGLDGCVASPQEIGVLRRALGPSWVIVTPGIRGRSNQAGRSAGPGDSASPGRSAGPGGSGGHVGAPRSNDDQVRVATPAAALRAGADYLVIGRPITAAPDPVTAARAILDELRVG